MNSTPTAPINPENTLDVLLGLNLPTSPFISTIPLIADCNEEIDGIHTSSHYPNSIPENPPPENVQRVFDSLLSPNPSALTSFLMTLTDPLFVSGAYFPVSNSAPQALSRDPPSTPFTHSDYFPSPHPDCVHTPAELKLALNRTSHLYKTVTATHSPAINNIISLSHSFYLLKFSQVLGSIYSQFSNKNGCPVCFFTDSTLWDSFHRCIDPHCLSALQYASLNTSYFSELGFWKHKLAQNIPFYGFPITGELDEQYNAVDKYKPPHPYQTVKHKNMLKNIEITFNNHYFHDCDEILECYTCNKASLKSPYDVVELYDSKNISCQYTIPKYYYGISLFSAALSVGNYDAFNAILFKCQELFGYVDPSVLYDLIDAGEYDLYNALTNYNQKLSIIPLNCSEQNSQVFEKYNDITFIKLARNLPQFSKKTNINETSLQPRIYSFNPTTNHSLISLLSKKLSLCPQETPQAYYLSTLLKFHMNILFHSSPAPSPIETPIIPPIVTEPDAVTYLLAHCPGVIPFHNFWHPHSIAYLSSRYAYTVQNLHPISPSQRLEDNVIITPPYYNQFFMARLAGPILSKYLWFIELLNLPFDQIAEVAQNIPDFSTKILPNFSIQIVYTILVHQHVSCVAKYFYLLANFAPSALQSITPSSNIANIINGIFHVTISSVQLSHNTAETTRTQNNKNLQPTMQSEECETGILDNNLTENDNDQKNCDNFQAHPNKLVKNVENEETILYHTVEPAELIVTLMINLIHYAIHQVFPLVHTERGWAQPLPRLVHEMSSFSAQNDVHTNIFSQKSIDAVLSWYTNENFPTTNSYKFYTLNRRNKTNGLHKLLRQHHGWGTSKFCYNDHTVSKKQLKYINMLHKLSRANPFFPESLFYESTSEFDRIHLKHIIAALFFPIHQLPIHHQISLPNQTHNSTPYAIIPSALHTIFFMVPKWGEVIRKPSLPEQFTQYPISPAYLPTMTPHLFLYLMAYYIQSISCIPHQPHQLHAIMSKTERLPVYTQRELTLVKAELAQHAILAFTMTRRCYSAYYAWNLIQLCSTLSSHYQNAAKEPMLSVDPTVPAISLSAQTVVCPSRLERLIASIVRNYDSYNYPGEIPFFDAKRIAGCVLMDKFLSTMYVESTVNTFHFTKFSGTPHLKEYFEQLYIYNIIHHLHSSNDLYYTMMKVMLIPTIEQFRTLSAPYDQILERIAGICSSSPNSRSPTQFFPVNLPLNPFVAVLSTCQPSFTATPFYDPVAGSYPMLPLLTQLFHDFRQAYIILLSHSSAPHLLPYSPSPPGNEPQPTFAQHILSAFHLKHVAYLSQVRYTNMIFAYQAHHAARVNRWTPLRNQIRGDVDASIHETFSQPFSLSFKHLPILSISLSFYLFTIKFTAATSLQQFFIHILTICSHDDNQQVIFSPHFVSLFIIAARIITDGIFAYKLHDIWSRILVIVTTTIIEFYGSDCSDMVMIPTQFITHTRRVIDLLTGVVKGNSLDNQVNITLLQWRQCDWTKTPSVLQYPTLYHTQSHIDKYSSPLRASSITHPVTSQSVLLNIPDFIVQWKPQLILLSVLQQLNDGGPVGGLFMLQDHSNPLTITNSTYDALNPVFQCIDTTDKYLLYWDTVDPYFRPFYQNINNVFFE